MISFRVDIPIRVDDELEDWGQYRPDAREIVLSERALQNSKTLRETLRHEIQHAALDIAGLSYLKHYEEEAIVRCYDNLAAPAIEKLNLHIRP